MKRKPRKRGRVFSRLAQKRALALQEALQAALLWERETRSAAARMVRGYRKVYAKLEAAGAPFERLLPPEIRGVEVDGWGAAAMVTPADFVHTLKEALSVGYDPGAQLGELRKLGPKLQKLPTPAQLRALEFKRAESKKRQDRIAFLKSYEPSLVHLVRVQLPSDAELATRFKTSSTAFEYPGLPLSEYRAMLQKQVDDINAERKTLGLEVIR